MLEDKKSLEETLIINMRKKNKIYAKNNKQHRWLILPPHIFYNKFYI